jgi:hypothetical protein
MFGQSVKYWLVSSICQLRAFLSHVHERKTDLPSLRSVCVFCNTGVINPWDGEPWAYFSIHFSRFPRARCMLHVSPGKSSVEMKMCMEQCWRDIKWGKQNCSDKYLSQCYFVLHKFHIYWPGFEPGALNVWAIVRSCNFTEVKQNCT